MSTTAIHHPSRLAVLACALALSFLYAPLGASYLVSKGACCISGMCNIAAHHHKQPPKTDDSPMDCGHTMGVAADCSLSCCQTPPQAATAAHIFLLPAAPEPPAPGVLSQSVSPAAPSELSRFAEPAFPPPRPSSSLFS